MTKKCLCFHLTQFIYIKKGKIQHIKLANVIYVHARIHLVAFNAANILTPRHRK